jgi:hypothetical protein
MCARFGRNILLGFEVCGSAFALIKLDAVDSSGSWKSEEIRVENATTDGCHQKREQAYATICQLLETRQETVKHRATHSQMRLSFIMNLGAFQGQ